MCSDAQCLVCVQAAVRLLYIRQLLQDRLSEFLVVECGSSRRCRISDNPKDFRVEFLLFKSRHDVTSSYVYCVTARFPVANCGHIALDVDRTDR